ncbi:hypothetical protein C8F01DRAFT_52432 [Mycena amicta]|nr:hypothetical protein C8F01DRAFT_52432 [Mycena amicta]
MIWKRPTSIPGSIHPKHSLSSSQLSSTGHTFFESTLNRFLPGPSSWVTSIDHPSNGLSLWHALHRLWDADRAAISVSRRCLILKKAKHPLSIIQGTTAARGLLEDLDFPREIKALLQLRFAHTMLVWFATQEFQDLLISSLEDDLEESEMQMDTGKPKLESDEKDASGGNMDDAMQNGGISGTGPTTSTVSRSQPSDSLDSTPTSTTGGTREEDDSGPDEDIPVPEKASHLPGCWCDVDADEFGPCMQLLLGGNDLLDGIGDQWTVNGIRV